MTLSEKINKLTWFSEVIKLKDILKDFLTLNTNVNTNITNLTADILDLQKPYKSYVALLTQTSTSTPTAVILESDLENNPTFGYVGVGEYSITLADFVVGRTTVVVANTIGTTSDRAQVYTDGAGAYKIYAYSSAGEKKNAVLLDTPIEIRIYS